MVLRVVLAEDSYIVREGVRALLESDGQIEVAGVCEDYDGLMKAVDETRPDVVLTDIRMPPTGTNEGIRAAKRLRETHPQVGVVVLSQYDEPAYALELLEGGSAGRAYLLKERVGEADEIFAAIREVADGGSVIDPKVVEGLVAARGRRPSKIDRLTPRETEVMAEIAKGKNNAAIAATLVLSERAVEKHINSIFSKLDLPPDDEQSHRRVRAVLMYLGQD